MPSVRSGFRKNKRSRRNLFKVKGNFLFKLKKLLSRNIFAPFKKMRRKGRGRRSKQYLNKDIHQKEYKNPHKKKNGSITGRLLGGVKDHRFRIAQGALLVLLLIWFYSLFLQPTFYIQNINIIGNKEIDTVAIEKKFTSFCLN